MPPSLCYNQAPALHLKEVQSCFFSLPSSQHLCKQEDNKWDKTAFMQELLHTEKGDPATTSWRP